jgi:calcineurin-like phosphoesterase family protein
MKDIKRDILDKITPEIKKEMESIHFTADLHAHHPKIVMNTNRPVYLSREEQAEIDILNKERALLDEDYNIYNSAEYKHYISPRNDEWLIKEVINGTVGKKDKLYILGDVTMANKKVSDKFLDRLNGDKSLIVGNHDSNIAKSTRFGEITQIKDFTFSRKEEGINIHIVLCHYPMMSWNRRVHGSWMLFGHVHGRLEGVGRSHDVGIDNLDNMHRPLNLYQICNIMAAKPFYNDDPDFDDRQKVTN